MFKNKKIDPGESKIWNNANTEELASFWEGWITKRWYVSKYKGKDGLYLYTKTEKKGYQPLCPVLHAEAWDTMDGEVKIRAVLFRASHTILGFNYVHMRVKKCLPELLQAGKKTDRLVFVNTIEKFIKGYRKAHHEHLASINVHGSSAMIAHRLELEGDRKLLLPWHSYVQWDEITQHLEHGMTELIEDKTRNYEQRIEYFVSYFFAPISDKLGASKHVSEVSQWKQFLNPEFFVKGGPFNFMISAISGLRRAMFYDREKPTIMIPGEVRQLEHFKIYRAFAVAFYGYCVHQSEPALSRFEHWKVQSYFESENKQQFLKAFINYFIKCHSLKDSVKYKWMTLDPKPPEERQTLHLIGEEESVPPETCFVDPPEWEKSDITFARVSLEVKLKGGVETVSGAAKVAFGDEIPGGTILSGYPKWHQEERIFACYPELLYLTMVLPSLYKREAWVVQGLRRVNDCKGKKTKFRVTGVCEDEDLHEVIGIDALVHGVKKPADLERECNKAYVGFAGADSKVLATGFWGLSESKGDKQLHSVIQLIAGAQANKNIVFMVEGDEEFKAELEDIYTFLVKENVTVSTLFDVLSFAGKKDKGEVFATIKAALSS